MRAIGILTFHNTSNYGAALQRYALEHVVRETGLEVESIDYNPPYRRSKYSPYHRISAALSKGNLLGIAKGIAAIPGILIRNYRFRLFYSSLCETSAQTITLAGNLGDYCRKYEVVVAGSDQIWNLNNNGDDLAFFLNFDNSGAQKISYASSMGEVSLDHKRTDQIISCLRDFRQLSVREKIAADLIEEVSGIAPKTVCDPTLLLSQQHWSSLAKPRHPKQHKFVVSYVNDPVFHEAIKEIVGPTGKVRIETFGSFGLLDMLKPQVAFRGTGGPADFLGSIRSSGAVFTTSYHAVIFSIIFEKPFWVFLSGNLGRDSRLIDLLKLLGLEDRIIEKNSTIPDFEEIPDFSGAKPLLEEYVAASKSYLIEALSVDEK